MESPFRHPSQMSPPEPREPVSARIPTTLKKSLEKIAKENKLSLAELIANILEDYVKWLQQEESEKK